MNLPAAIHRLRKARGLTFKALAQKAGITPTGLFDIEKGIVKSPYLCTVELIAKAFNMTASELVRLAEEPNA